MEQLYHFYVEINNLENKKLKLSSEQIRLLDKIWQKILRKIETKPSEKQLSQIIRNVQQSV